MPLLARAALARHFRLILAATLAVTLTISVACGSDAPTGPKDVPGTYVLRTVDGLPLPFTVTNPREHVIVVYLVTATLNANSTYAMAGTGTQDGDASTVITDAGTYSQSGSTLHFTSTTFGAEYGATAKTDSITVTLPGGFVDSSSDSFSLLFVKSR